MTLANFPLKNWKYPGKATIYILDVKQLKIDYETCVQFHIFVSSTQFFANRVSLQFRLQNLSVRRSGKPLPPSPLASECFHVIISKGS